MPNHLSNLGIFHTVISILALIFGVAALIREGKIDPRSGTGKWYIVLTILTCLTSFGIMKTGHFTPAHGLSVLVLLLLPLGIYAGSIGFFGTAGPKIGVATMSATLFFSFIPAITETLTRLPISHPIAGDPNAPAVKMSLLVLLVLFAVGLVLQLRRIGKGSPTAVN
ncbi:MAG: hypothetical protein P4L51_20000 [Puia sp.]|nr:hypothetical protein [Puia sp.]